jgi:acetoin utilization protein AcuB
LPQSAARPAPPATPVTSAGGGVLYTGLVSIKRIMSKSVVTVSPDDPLHRIKEIFDRHGFHHLLVVEGGVLVGVISDRDLLKSLSPHLGTAAETTRDLATLNKRAHQIMSRRLITLGEDASIQQAVAALSEHRISCLPIVDAARHPVGIVSWRDILKAIRREPSL